MADRGRAHATLIATGSNTLVKSSAGSLYELHIWPINGGTVKVNDGDMGPGTDMHLASGNSIDLIGPFTTPFAPITVTYGPGVGFESLTIAATSNTRVTAVWE
jgi:hypothetical protein